MQTILSTSDILLVPTVEKEIPYIWDLLDQWPSGCVWKSMYKDYEDFEEDIKLRLKDHQRDAIWTCWTKSGKASKKFGIAMLTKIAFGLSADIHGIADKEFYKNLQNKRLRRTYADKAADLVLKHCFETLGVARVNATFYKKDPLVMALLKRHGFKRHAVLQKSVYINEQIHPTYIYGLLEDDYLGETKNV